MYSDAEEELSIVTKWIFLVLAFVAAYGHFPP